MLPEVPPGSIYYWMYKQGLKHVPYADIEMACRIAGKEIREKDRQNYWNGWYKSDLYGEGGGDCFKLTRHEVPAAQDYFDLAYEDYPVHPYLYSPEIERRFVPCNENNKPMIKWGTEGCLSYVDASCWPNSKYLAENTAGCKFIVVDCDGDHELPLDMQTISFLHRYVDSTHVLNKPKAICEYEGYEHSGWQDPASFHLTFKVDRIIPTMHFPEAHIDIVGNRKNSLRYFKNKVWNKMEPAPMTPEIWEEIKRYVKYRKEKACQ